MNQSKQDIRPRARGSRARRRRGLFASASVVLSLGLVACLELALRLAPAPCVLDPYLEEAFPLGYMQEVKRDGVRCWKITLDHVTHADTDLAPLRKTPKTFRVFCLGSSASAGWPHPRQETYAAYLRQALGAAFPDRRIEVIDWSGHAYPSYLTRLVFFHALQCSPDMIALYAGNNECMLGPHYHVPADGPRLSLWPLRQLRLAQWIDRLVANPIHSQQLDFDFYRKRFRSSPYQAGLLQQVPMALRTRPDQYRMLLDHYRFDIGSILDACHERSIPVVLMTVPVNQADWRPIASLCNLTGARRRQWMALLEQARDRALAGDFAGAAGALDEALRMAPDHAETWHERGRLAARLGDFDKARVAFQKAVDLDARPYRAGSKINAILAALAAGRSDVTLVDLARLFAEASPHGLVGDNLFLDHVHANRQGNLLVAREAYRAVAARLVGPGGKIPPFPAIAPARLPGGGVYSEENDLQLQSTILATRCVMRQSASIAPWARHVIALLSDHAGFAPDSRNAPMTRGSAEKILAMGEAVRGKNAPGQLDIFPSLGMSEMSAAALEACHNCYLLF